MRPGSFLPSFGRVFAVLGAAGLASAIFGPIGTDKPNPPGGTVSNTGPPLSSFFAGHNPPYPTNDWWSGYGAGTGDAVTSGPFPYESSLQPAGINFGISTSRQFDGTSIKQPTQTDWTAGFSEHSGNRGDHKALSWDRQSVTVQYFTGSSTLTTYLVPGSPYLTFNYAGATPKFTSGQGLITSFGGQNIADGGSATVSGTRFEVVNSAGTYIIYSLSGSITLKASAASGSGTIVASAPFNGVLRVVKLNDPSHATLLDQHSSTYPTAVDTDYSFPDANTGVLTFTWTTTGAADDLLLLTWPHHRKTLQNPNYPATTALNYLTTKGYMYPILGNVWNMKYTLPNIDFDAPRAPDASCTTALIQGLEYEISQLEATTPDVPGDFYGWGNKIAAKARLALIADHVGRQDLVQPVIQWLETTYSHWFDSSSAVLAAYEQGWGGIINKDGATNVNVDYGNGFYNDHHFHYGYFLSGAAVIAKFDNNWLNQHGAQVTYFLRDILNPSPQDPYFPVTRHRDWFAGHSWASGIANGAGSRDQESSGEAINGYYGSLLWATVAEASADFRNYARLMLATEIQATQVYWHLYPSASSTDRDNAYPEADVRQLITMGNVEDWQSGAWLFWGDQKVEIAAIQILPVTPDKELLYDSEWVQNIMTYAADELNDTTGTYADSWKSVIYAALSNADPKRAATLSTTLTDWGSGNTYSNQLYFISTRPNAAGACSAAPSNPIGNFTIQAADSGKYVVADGSSNLIASSTSQSSASKFNFGFSPNGGTILLQSNNQFVTADQSGNYDLQAARATASAWEIFIIRQKVGAASGVYTIQAASNHQYVTLGGDGALINNGPNESAGAGFRIA
ncbi:glycoside hydrolase family 81 protein [Dentipellis sp. KUC8613]|nr:glycoside hydrolase family 81 protein [Dentipellis sp. KUC8613]